MSTYEFLLTAFSDLLLGLPLTLQLAGTSILFGVALAIPLTFARMSKNKAIRQSAIIYILGVRGTPMILQLFFVYYGLGQFRETLVTLNLWWLFRDPYWCAVLTISLNTAAYNAEIFRTGIQSVPFGQLEAADAFGMPPLTKFFRVTFPLAIRQALPATGNEMILVVKGTALASVITLMEITGRTASLVSMSFRTFEVFACAALIYLVLVYSITLFFWFIEHKVLAEKRHRPAATNAQPAP